MSFVLNHVILVKPSGEWDNIEVDQISRDHIIKLLGTTNEDLFHIEITPKLYMWCKSRVQIDPFDDFNSCATAMRCARIENKLGTPVTYERMSGIHGDVLFTGSATATSFAAAPSLFDPMQDEDVVKVQVLCNLAYRELKKVE